MSKRSRKVEMDSTLSPNPNKVFDIDNFNGQFVFMKEEQKKKNQKINKDKLDKLNRRANPHEKKLYELSFYELCVELKNSWFGILDDILDLNFSSSGSDILNIFIKDNRLFFIGLTIIIIAIVIYIYNYYDENKTNITSSN